MSKDDRTDRFRPVFEPEDIFDRFVRNANASTEELVPRDDEPTGRVPHEAPGRGITGRESSGRESSGRQSTGRQSTGRQSTGRQSTGRQSTGRGGPPSWDHAITVKGPPPQDGVDDDGTRPDAPMPLAIARAFSGGAAEDDDSASGVHVDEDDLTRPRASPLTDSGQRILLLTRIKQPGSQPPLASAPLPVELPTPAMTEPSSPPSGERTWDSVVSPRGLHTQRLEAMRVVPDVEAAASRHGDTYVGEGIEDGQMPTRQLDQILSDMAVLLRYGHAAQVRDRLEQLRRTYPEDLLLLRGIAEFHVENEQFDAALETLFALAGGLFERRNVEGMRQALEQVLVLDPDNARAYRLLGLLEQRPDAARD